mgnify:CR=1 FL=1
MHPSMMPRDDDKKLIVISDTAFEHESVIVLKELNYQGHPMLELKHEMFEVVVSIMVADPETMESILQPVLDYAKEHKWI